MRQRSYRYRPSKTEHIRQATAAQLRKIHALAGERGMDDDLLHEYVYAQVQVKSLKELTVSQAITVIDVLEGSRSPKGWITGKQSKYIEALAVQIGWVTGSGTVDMDRLNGFLKKQVDREGLRKLSSREASEIIEALKGMKARKEKKEHVQEGN